MLESYTKTIALAAVASIIAVLALSIIMPSSDDYMPDNPYWNGQNVFAKTVNVTFTEPKNLLLEPENTILFIISPEKNITEDYTLTLKNFVESGGTLVLMDETGKINPILEELDVGVKVEPYPIMDPLYYYRSWNLPKVTNINPTTPITKNITIIATDVPAAIKIEGMQNIKILAYTSYFSYMDLDGDGQPSKDDPVGPFPVIVEKSYGDGKIIVASDSSLFINSIIVLGDNKILLKNIVGEKNAIVDSSLWNPSAHSRLKTFTEQAYNMISAPEIKYTLVACVATITYITVRKEKIEEEKADELQQVLEKHPEWNQQLLKTLKEARENVIQ
ncbi:MAG: DUF4350 domain-containing protein [Nitrososphaeria archaeon]|nr:DUF4350 domain-containing protein [Nitrososphaeria archaeon]